MFAFCKLLLRVVSISVVAVSLLLLPALMWAQPRPAAGQTASGDTAVAPKAGTTTVNANITNSVAHPVPVRNNDEAGRHPFQQSLACSVNPGQAACFANFTVPAHSELVIEYINVLSIPNQIADPSGSFLQSTDLTISTVPGQYHFDLGAKGFNSVNNFFTKSELVKIYIQPDAIVTFAGRTINTTGNETFEAMISGYLVDLP